MAQDLKEPNQFLAAGHFSETIMLRLLPRKPVRIELDSNGQIERDTSMSLQRRQMVEQIMALNPSATPDFLDQFEDQALTDYLQHLAVAHQPRGKDARWIRPHGKPWAFVAAACA